MRVFPASRESSRAPIIDLPSLHPLGRVVRCGRVNPGARTADLVHLALAMGIPSHDAASQVMDLVTPRAKLPPCESDTRVR